MNPYRRASILLYGSSIYLPRTSAISISRTLRLESSNQFSDKKTNSLSEITLQLLKHASCFDIGCMFVGCILAIVNGACSWPLLILFASEFTQHIADILNTTKNVDHIIAVNQSQNLDFTMINSSAKKEWMNAIWNFTYPAVACTIISLLICYLWALILNYTAERIVFTLKKLYIKSILIQNMSWFDTKSQGGLISTITTDLDKIQMALGYKFGFFLLSISEICTSLIISFSKGWQLTLTIIALYPILIAAKKISIKFQEKYNDAILILKSDLSQRMREIIPAIRTVYAFGGEQVELNKFKKRLVYIKRKAIKQGIIQGIYNSFVLPLSQCFITLSIWYGIRLIENKDVEILFPQTKYTVESVKLIALLLLFSTIFTRQASILSDVIGDGYSTLTDIINVIESKPKVDSGNNMDQISQNVRGSVQFRSVCFHYPSNSELEVLKNFNLNIKSGEFVALVGSSGEGKSTIFQLLQRFYDPQDGEIIIGGVPIREFDIGWVRRNIGVVGQKPSLFNTSIKQNIKYGNVNASDEDVIQAAKDANAHEFIINLPKQYNTIVGKQGCLLSAGQKQRIAIARALIKNPIILLIDESKTILDSESELKIQESLDNARNGRTVIAILPKLNIIQNADRIIGIKDGRVVEQGNHKELLAIKGLYYQLLHSESEIEQPEEELKASEIDKNTNKYCKPEQEYSSGFILENYSFEPLKKSGEIKEYWKILKFCKYNWLLFVGVIIFSCLTAWCFPLKSYLVGKLISVIVEEDYRDLNNDEAYWANLYLISGGIIFFASILKFSVQSLAEENWLFCLRQSIIETILKQEVGWFDEPDQDVGNLASLMMVDAENIKSIPGALIGNWISACTIIVIIISLSLIICWEVSLVALALFIIILVSCMTNEKLDQKLKVTTNSANNKANNFTIEVVRNHRLIAALNIGNTISDEYNKLLDQPKGLQNKFMHLLAISLSISSAFCLLSFAVIFGFGAYIMLSYNDVKFSDIAILSVLLTLNILEVSLMFTEMPCSSKVSSSAERILRLFMRKPLIDNSKSAGIQLSVVIQPKIEFKNVSFAYPTRPDNIILRNFSLVIESGEDIAFVGEHGCGKSTVLQLLLRFYDPIEGEVTINGYDIRSINLTCLRKLIGFVLQEPVIFNRSIADNISYGNNEKKVEIGEVLDASKKAYIHQFVATLSQGYDTLIGSNGFELSYGQKKKVAIARALIKNPKILLLDEATSVLDNKSEQAIQQSLETVKNNRSCIIIANRLSSIQNAGKFVVFTKNEIIVKNSLQEFLEYNEDIKSLDGIN